MQIVVGTSSDVSWLISLCEKSLVGKRLYVDFIESNPPAAVFLYMPAVATARAIGVRAEFLVALYGFVAIAASLALSARILATAGLTRGVGPAGYGVAAFVLAVLPSAVFDQREHLALIFGLPFLAALTTRASGGKVDAWAAAAAGVGAAIMISVKPYFVLTIAPVLLYAVVRAGWAALFAALEIYVFAAVAAVGLAASVALFPDYFHKVAPLVAAVYVPQRRTTTYLATRPAILCWIVPAFYLWPSLRRRFDDPLTVAPVLAAVGALAAYFLQGKGWPYQAYPAVALLALALAASRRPAGGTAAQGPDARLPLAAAATLAIAVGAFSEGARPGDAALARIVGATAPHPKILMIGGDIALAFPLTREIGGEWVGTYPFLWVTDTIAYWRSLGEIKVKDEARFAALLDDDRATLAADIKRERPDAILIADDEWRRWALSEKGVAEAFAPYAPLGRAGEATVYGLADRVPAQ
jgi:hypothetical protein